MDQLKRFSSIYKVNLGIGSSPNLALNKEKKLDFFGPPTCNFYEFI